MNPSGAKRLLSAGDSAGIDSGGMLGVYPQNSEVKDICAGKRFVVVSVCSWRGWLVTATAASVLLLAVRFVSGVLVG